MNVEESIERFGINPREDDLPQIRNILAEESARESKEQGSGDTELMRLSAVQLFSKGLLDDVMVIWRAKTASMDADGSIDIQLLAGAGLEKTKSYLNGHENSEAREALSRILEAEAAGDFDDFSMAEQMEAHHEYYSETEDDSELE